MTTIEKSVLLAMSCERANVIILKLQVLKSELEILIREVYALHDQLKPGVPPPLDS